MAGNKNQRRRRAGAAGPPSDRLRGPWYLRWGARGLVGGVPLSIILAAILLTVSCNHRFAKVFVPGSAEAWLDAGAYTIFYEYPERVSWWSTPEVGFTLTAVDSGVAVPLHEVQGHGWSTEGTRAYVPLYDVSVEPGRHALSAWFTGESTRADIAIAIGRGPSERIGRFVWIVVVIVGGFALWIGLAVQVSRFMRRQPPW
jgi:hypothetical protein